MGNRLASKFASVSAWSRGLFIDAAVCFDAT